jgi:hypothetical protein
LLPGGANSSGRDFHPLWTSAFSRRTRNWRLNYGLSELAAAIRTEAGYFERNAERMRDPQFRKRQLFVGSGVIEAGCKTVIGSRLKRSAMFWTVRSANAVIALRCCRHSRHSDDYWERRRG